MRLGWMGIRKKGSGEDREAMKIVDPLEEQIP
jgi:hypothetical protein